MRHLLTLLTFILLFTFSLSAQEYTITVSARKYSEPYMAYLQYKGPNGEFIDSAEVKNGMLTFKGKIDEPRPASIVFKVPGKKVPAQDKLKFFIEPGNLTVDARSVFANASVTGSVSTKEFEAIDKLLLKDPAEPQPVMVERRIVAVPAGQAPPRIATTSRSPVRASAVPKRPAEDPSAPPYDLLAVVGGIGEDSKAKVLEYVNTHPGSFVSGYVLYALWKALKLNYADYSVLVNSLDPAVRTSNEGKVMFGG